VRTRAQCPGVQGTQPVGASNGEKTSIGKPSDAEGMRRRDAEVGVEDPKVQGTGYQTLILGGAKGRRASSARASARVQDPEARRRPRAWRCKAPSMLVHPTVRKP
jgi:hypothetical protein